MKKRFEADTDKLPEVMDFIEEELGKQDYPFQEIMTFQLVAEEIFVNIASYAYTDGTGYCDIEIRNTDSGIEIAFTDEGIAFNPLEKEDPDISSSAEDRQIGGLGIYMTRKMMDDVRYQRTDNRNVLTVLKKGR